MGWNETEILTATGGKMVRAGSSSRFGEVVTDSAKVKKGSVFVALKGEKFDGHSFAADAVKRGAVCLIVHRSVRLPARSSAAVIKVTDTLRALGDLAHFRREQFNPKVLAITGSNGKTTTKEMVAAILEEASLDGEALRGKVLKTEGNFNNLVGLPLTLLRLRKAHRVAVVELGTNHPGEIQRLAEIADPDVAVITSVAAAHLEGLSSIAGVAREKGSLFNNIRAGGAIAVNIDDPWVRRLGAKFRGAKLTYGNGGRLKARSVHLNNATGVGFTLHAGKQRCAVRLNYLGQHNVTNALGAAGLALAAGVSLAAVRRGLAKARPFTMRMQLEKWRGIRIINDAYNANLASMRAALRTLAEIPARGRKIAVLGDMFELGRYSRQQHRELGKAAAQAKIQHLYLLGQESDAVRQGALGARMAPERVTIGKDHNDLANQLRSHVRAGDWLLFKGSRGMKMESVFNQLRNEKA